MNRLYVADGETYESLSDAIDNNTGGAANVLVVKQVGYIDELLQNGVIPGDDR